MRQEIASCPARLGRGSAVQRHFAGLGPPMYLVDGVRHTQTLAWRVRRRWSLTYYPVIPEPSTYAHALASRPSRVRTAPIAVTIHLSIHHVFPFGKTFWSLNVDMKIL